MSGDVKYLIYTEDEWPFEKLNGTTFRAGYITVNADECWVCSDIYRIRREVDVANNVTLFGFKVVLVPLSRVQRTIIDLMLAGF